MKGLPQCLGHLTKIVQISTPVVIIWLQCCANISHVVVTRALSSLPHHAPSVLSAAKCILPS